MATVGELSEPYLNHQVSALPPGEGVCAVCRTAVTPGFRYCRACGDARGYGARRADVVVPIALAVKREQLAHELWQYKSDTDPRVRQRLEIRLAAVLWRFLSAHEACAARACAVDGFTLVTTVPRTTVRAGENPLARLVGTVIGHTSQRYEPLLTPSDGATDLSRNARADRYRATRELPGARVLLIDDAWTTGSRVQSAAIALRAAGAATVVVVIGRHFDRSFGTGEQYYTTAKTRGFTWHTCCLE